jgi:hypothetical protein
MTTARYSARTSLDIKHVDVPACKWRLSWSFRRLRKVRIRLDDPLDIYVGWRIASGDGCSQQIAILSRHNSARRPETRPPIAGWACRDRSRQGLCAPHERESALLGEANYSGGVATFRMSKGNEFSPFTRLTPKTRIAAWCRWWRFANLWIGSSSGAKARWACAWRGLARLLPRRIIACAAQSGSDFRLGRDPTQALSPIQPVVRRR